MFSRLSRLFSFRHVDWVITIILFLFTAIGLSAIYSVDLSRGEALIVTTRQALAIGIAWVGYIVVANTHVSVFRNNAKFLYLFSIILLVAVLIGGVTIRGTTGWFRIAGFSLQPVEFAKVSLLLFLAYWMYRYNRRFYSWQFVVSTAFFTLLPIFLTLLQPDLGSALLMGMVWFGLLLVAHTKKRYLLFVITLIGFFGFASWFFFLAPYQKERLLSFVSSERDPLGSGYNVTQSIIAIGSGKFFGRGLGFGSQSQLHFLPEAQTDFLFAVIGEELGFIGISVVVLLYMALIFQLIRLARASRDDFSAYVCIGAALLVSIQAFINMSATLGILPVTGIPLPMLSVGGTSFIMFFFLLGIVQSIARSRHTDHPMV